MKNFVKAMNREGDGFKFLKDFFGADKSDAKLLKAGVFVDPEIKKLMLNKEFDLRLNSIKLAAWKALKSVVNFLRNHRHDQYPDIVDRMMKAYEQ